MQNALAALLGVGLLAPPAWATVTLKQNNPAYTEGVHYSVLWNEDGEPQIRILQPSDPEDGPYDFESILTEDPNMPANIAGFYAGMGLHGDVELMVRSSEPSKRPFGAANVKNLQIENENVHLTLKEFVIYDYLGPDIEPADTYVYAIDGPFEAMGLNVDSDLHVQYLSGDFTLIYNYADIEVTESVTHYANVEILNFIAGSPHDLTIAGTLAGDLTLGDPESGG
jgi:hypothetical protein